MGCDRLGSSCWTLCSLLGRFQRAGRDTKDFLSLGEGRDTEKFAQSLKQRASGSAVLESLGLAGVQGLLHTAAEYRDSLRTSLWMPHNVQLWSPFKCFTSLLCATYSDTNCILKSGTFCQARDNTCPERLPLNRPSSVTQAQPRPETRRLNAHVQADALSSCRANKVAFWGHRQRQRAE